MKNISRRGFISGTASVVGAGISFGFLTSCGDGSTSGQDSLADSSADSSAESQVESTVNPKATTSKITPVDFPSDLQLVQRFPQVLVPGEVRLPISLALSSGVIRASSDFNFPQMLEAKIIDLATDKVVTENIGVSLHGAEISIPYYPFRTNIEKPGNYLLVVSGGPNEGAAFSVQRPDEVLIPKVGEMMPSFDTPTFANSQEVASICTRKPEPCPFHEITLTEALKLKVPVAYLIGTPAHCATSTCSPASEQLIKVAKSVGNKAVFVHAEVYADDAATKISPAVKALNLSFEPALFVVDASGVIAERLDAVFDGSEISQALVKAGVK